MDKIYEQAKDLHVRNYVVYGEPNNYLLYNDADFTSPVKIEDAYDAFRKGSLLISSNGTSLNAIGFSFNDSAVYTLGSAGASMIWGFVTEESEESEDSNDSSDPDPDPPAGDLTT